MIVYWCKDKKNIQNKFLQNKKEETKTIIYPYLDLDESSNSNSFDLDELNNSSNSIQNELSFFEDFSFSEIYNENNEIENNNNLRFNYLSNKDTLKKIREENNLNLKILQKKLTENFEEKETEKIIKYDLNPINYSRILKPKNLKQKYDYNNINNDYFSARNNIEYLNEKLKLNEQKRKMIMDKYINESNSNIIKRNKLSFQDYLLNNSKKNFHTEDIVNSERINDFFFKQNI